MERIPILRMGEFLLVTIQVDMHDQLALMAARGPTEAELTRAKAVSRASMLMGLEAPTARAEARLLRYTPERLLVDLKDALRKSARASKDAAPKKSGSKTGKARS